MRKTIDVETVRGWTNTRLACPDSTTHHLDKLTPQQAFRLGAASLLEQILHATGNYRGFNYLDSEWEQIIVNGKTTTHFGGLRDNYDDSRRRYKGQR